LISELTITVGVATTRNVVVVVPFLFDTVKWYRPACTDFETFNDNVIVVGVDFTTLMTTPLVVVETVPPFRAVPVRTIEVVAPPLTCEVTAATRGLAPTFGSMNRIATRDDVVARCVASPLLRATTKHVPALDELSVNLVGCSMVQPVAVPFTTWKITVPLPDPPFDERATGLPTVPRADDTLRRACANGVNRTTAANDETAP
jgi:hypothetical protein